MFVAASAVLTPALADVCAQLNAQLGALQRSSGGGNMAALMGELQQAQHQVARQGCRRGFLFFGATGGPNCDRLMARVDRLHSQISTLRRHGGSGQADALIRQMGRYGCSVAPRTPSRPRAPSSYRTVCVRHCDGYHFPIAYEAKKSDFEEHAALCAARFPDGEASLYYHGTGEEVAENLVSVDGDRYADKSFAFRYRETYDAGCPKPLKVMSPAELDEIQEVADAVGLKSGGGSAASAVPVPRPRPIASADPESAMARFGGFDIGTARRLVAEARQPREIRVVGPVAAYYLSPPPDAPVQQKAEANDDLDLAATAALETPSLADDPPGAAPNRRRR